MRLQLRKVSARAGRLLKQEVQVCNETVAKRKLASDGMAKKALAVKTQKQGRLC